MDDEIKMQLTLLHSIVIVLCRKLGLSSEEVTEKAMDHFLDMEKMVEESKDLVAALELDRFENSGGLKN